MRRKVRKRHDDVALIWQRRCHDDVALICQRHLMATPGAGTGADRQAICRGGGGTSRAAGRTHTSPPPPKCPHSRRRRRRRRRRNRVRGRSERIMRAEGAGGPPSLPPDPNIGDSAGGCAISQTPGRALVCVRRTFRGCANSATWRAEDGNGAPRRARPRATPLSLVSRGLLRWLCPPLWCLCVCAVNGLELCVCSVCERIAAYSRWWWRARARAAFAPPTSDDGGRGGGERNPYTLHPAPTTPTPRRERDRTKAIERTRGAAAKCTAAAAADREEGTARGVVVGCICVGPSARVRPGRGGGGARALLWFSMCVCCCWWREEKERKRWTPALESVRESGGRTSRVVDTDENCCAPPHSSFVARRRSRRDD